MADRGALRRPIPTEKGRLRLPARPLGPSISSEWESTASRGPLARETSPPASSHGPRTTSDVVAAPRTMGRARDGVTLTSTYATGLARRRMGFATGRRFGFRANDSFSSPPNGSGLDRIVVRTFPNNRGSAARTRTFGGRSPFLRRCQLHHEVSRVDGGGARCTIRV